MAVTFTNQQKINVKTLNEAIRLFPQVYPITEDMNITYKGVSRLVMLDRYSFKDTEKLTLTEGDFVVLQLKKITKFPLEVLGIYFKY